jgi:hypothetical protein
VIADRVRRVHCARALNSFFAATSAGQIGLGVLPQIEKLLIAPAAQRRVADQSRGARGAEMRKRVVSLSGIHVGVTDDLVELRESALTIALCEVTQAANVYRVTRRKACEITAKRWFQKLNRFSRPSALQSDCSSNRGDPGEIENRVLWTSQRDVLRHGDCFIAVPTHRESQRGAGDDIFRTRRTRNSARGRRNGRTAGEIGETDELVRQMPRRLVGRVAEQRRVNGPREIGLRGSRSPATQGEHAVFLNDDIVQRALLSPRELLFDASFVVLSGSNSL